MLNKPLLLCLALCGCGAGTALKVASTAAGLAGGNDGTQVGVDVQAGGERSTGINSSEDTAQRVGGRNNSVTQTTEKNEVRTIERVETINNNERIPTWIWFFMLMGWLLDSPQRVFQDSLRAFRRRR